jgi:hypothetical protein
MAVALPNTQKNFNAAVGEEDTSEWCELRRQGHYTNLLESNSVAVLTEALTAHINVVLADQTMSVGADAAKDPVLLVAHQESQNNRSYDHKSLISG